MFRSFTKLLSKIVFAYKLELSFNRKFTDLPVNVDGSFGKESVLMRGIVFTKNDIFFYNNVALKDIFTCMQKPRTQCGFWVEKKINILEVFKKIEHASSIKIEDNTSFGKNNKHFIYAGKKILLGDLKLMQSCK